MSPATPSELPSDSESDSELNFKFKLKSDSDSASDSDSDSESRLGVFGDRRCLNLFTCVYIPLRHGGTVHASTSAAVQRTSFPPDMGWDPLPEATGCANALLGFV